VAAAHSHINGLGIAERARGPSILLSGLAALRASRLATVRACWKAAAALCWLAAAAFCGILRTPSYRLRCLLLPALAC